MKNGGAVISEFPFGRTPDRETFPQRNRIVAALASGVVAIECPLKSGTLITTARAAEMGRVVMAVPGRVDSRASAGCHELIRDGAVLVRSAADVTMELTAIAPVRPRKPSPAADGGAEAPAPKPPPVVAPPLPKFSLDEAAVMRFVDREGVSIDRLVALTALPVAKINAITMALRLKGRVRFLPGNRVALPRES